MIYFYENIPAENSCIDLTILPEDIILDPDVWDNGKKIFRENLCCDAADIRVIPVKNSSQEIICYAYQDDEANRELRMLKELEACKEALQFGDIFPNINEVVVCGCNELAYNFVKYLEKQHIKVSVKGKYWEYLKYDNSGDLNCNNSKMIVYAEAPGLHIGGINSRIIRSASPEFECIDTIYETNVKVGKIKDIAEGLEGILEKLRGKKVVVLGIDAEAQDTYDFLYANGIDICCFAEMELLHTGSKTLLGKRVVGIKEGICREEEVAFINCHDINSALGSRDIEFFDYYGYARNEQMFLIRDYVDIPCSNLIHVLKGKRVWLAGRKELCMLVADYMKDVEHGDIDVSYVELSQCTALKVTDILCIVYPWDSIRNITYNPKTFCFREELEAMGNLSYTDYFSCTKSFVLIDLYRNSNREKYSIKELIPKGILLGRIPGASGSVLFQGIFDGHPEILKWGYNALNHNLFLYCICLANEKSENVLKLFKKMFEEEYIFQLEANIACWDKFQKRAEKMLSLKRRFSSQELFIIFHIAYAEMMSGEQLTDIRDKVIYWEPHMLPRNEFPFLARWLEDEKINGQTVYMHRDNLVWAGSWYKFYEENPSSLDYICEIARDNIAEEEDVFDQHWTEFHMRFEDIKLYPRRELTKICDKFEIPWSDKMLKTTKNGETWDHHGIKDFDIKPIFNKYEEYLSEFDRFRISLISAAYQKMYGYTYENSMKFSRREIGEIFLKKFRFQEKLQFENEGEKVKYYLRAHELIRWKLWKARKHEVLGDILPRLEQFDIGQSVLKKEPPLKKQAARKPTSKEIKKLVEFVRRQEKLILYGIGKDCEALLEYLDGNSIELLFCDTIAAYKEILFHGSRVIPPESLCESYNDYHILITSSRYYKSIYRQLTELGVCPNRITCNKFQLWEDE